jgi:hypothetical protein
MTDHGSMTRRTFLMGAGSALVPSLASAQSMIIRPEISVSDPRYAMYATIGERRTPPSPASFRTIRSKVVVYHPTNVEEARLIVFSHAALADPTTYHNLLLHWASHGFVVVAPLHDDAAIERGLSYRKSSASGASEWQFGELLDNPIAWRERTDACSGCLDAIPLITQATGIHIVNDRPVIAGHGYGAYIAQLLLGGTVVEPDGKRGSFHDDRFFSGILLSPQGSGIMGLDARSWEKVAAPLLTVVAEGDRDFGKQDAEKKSEPFKLSAPGYKHLYRLKGGSSNSFAGQLSGTNASEAKLFEIIKAVTTAFLMAYASYDEKAFADVSSNFFERMSLGIAKEFRR